MTDDEFWSLLLTHPATAQHTRELRRDPAGWQVADFGDGPAAGFTYELVHLYLDMPLVDGRPLPPTHPAFDQLPRSRGGAGYFLPEWFNRAQPTAWAPLFTESTKRASLFGSRSNAESRSPEQTSDRTDALSSALRSRSPSSAHRPRRRGRRAARGSVR